MTYVMISISCLSLVYAFLGQAEGTNNNCSTLPELTRELWHADVERFSEDELTLQFQTQVPDGYRQDASPLPLFSYVKETRLNESALYSSFISLLDNYNPEPKEPEQSADEETEIDAFLDLVLDTELFGHVMDYLKCKGRVADRQELSEELKKIWFEFYPRSGFSSILDSSGFEHVFLSEFKNSTMVNGLHNWIFFYLQEKQGLLNYYGYVGKVKEIVAGAALNWRGHYKDLASFFVGTSPAFDLAVYTLCYLEHFDQQCNITVADGMDLTIRTYNSTGHVATAFVELEVEDIEIPPGGTSPTATCQDRCGAAYDVSMECQCHDACKEDLSCCQDYVQLCFQETPNVGRKKRSRIRISRIQQAHDIHLSHAAVRASMEALGLKPQPHGTNV